METRYLAHSLENRPKSEWQSLEEHLKNVSKKAAKSAAKFQSADWGWNAGWLHDLGKAAPRAGAWIETGVSKLNTHRREIQQKK